MPEDVRRRVSDAYARAVTRGGGCCGPGCSSEPRQKGVVVKSAGYDSAALDALPEDAVVNSFGCGDPVAFSELSSGETVLDLGCGAGIDLLLAAERVGLEGRVIGVDMTDEMLDRATKNIRASGFSNVEVRKGYIEELPVEDATVDVVISNCVVNLSPDKPQVFSEIARVLKPGGRIRISDLVAESLPQWVKENPDLYSSCIAGAITEAEYVAGLEAAGLTEVQIADRLVYDPAQLSELLGSELPESDAREYEDLLARASRELGGRVASVLVTGKKAE
ncbi:MAG: arsenite methyltransferase [Thermoleophilia bacterium]